MFVSVQIFCLTLLLWDGKGRGRKQSNTDFFKPSFSVSGGFLSLCVCTLCFPSHFWAMEAKIAMNIESGWVPWQVFFFHSSFTTCCSDYTMQHITSVERKDKGRVCPREGLAILMTTKHPMLSAHTVSANKGKNTLESRTFFSSWVYWLWFWYFSKLANCRNKSKSLFLYLDKENNFLLMSVASQTQVQGSLCLLGL